MENKKLLIWIDLYGEWDTENRQPVELISYDHYLDQCVRAVILFKNRITEINLSGGTRDAQDRTECETAGPEFERRLHAAGIVDFKINVNDECLTSVSAILKLLIRWREKYPNTIPLYFCDEARYEANLFIFDKHCEELEITNLKAKESIVSIKRLDTDIVSTKEVQAKRIEAMKKNGLDCII